MEVVQLHFLLPNDQTYLPQRSVAELWLGAAPCWPACLGKKAERKTSDRFLPPPSFFKNPCLLRPPQAEAAPYFPPSLKTPALRNFSYLILRSSWGGMFNSSFIDSSIAVLRFIAAVLGSR